MEMKIPGIPTKYLNKNQTVFLDITQHISVVIETLTGPLFNRSNIAEIKWTAAQIRTKHAQWI